MLAFIVLFTIFVGLIAIYVLFTERKKKAHPDAAVRLHRWLDARGAQLPSVERTIDILNGALCIGRKKSARWDAPAISALLPGTPLPRFTVQSVELETDDCFKMVCSVSWPSCAPGVEVLVTEKGSGNPLTCHLQVDAFRAKVHVTMERGSDGLLITFEHVHKPVVALSCVVCTTGIKDSDGLANDLCSALQSALGELRFSRAEATDKPHPHVEVQITPAMELDEDHVDGPLPIARMASGITTPSDTAVGEATPTTQQQATPTAQQQATPTTQQQSAVPTAQSTVDGSSTSVPRQDSQAAGGKERDKPEGRQGVAPEVVAPKTPEVPSLPAQTALSSTPVSLAWKRSPSYEQLHELPAPRAAALSPWDSSECLGSPYAYARPSTGSSAELNNLEDTFSATSEENYPSTLVYEVGNPGHLRHLVAISPAHAKKLHRNFPHAKKLHLYNDHFFSATHTKQKQICAVCGEKLSGVFGKQGYQCRECSIWVHKPCHVKAEVPCPSSKSSSINLIYPDSVSTASKY